VVRALLLGTFRLGGAALLSGCVGELLADRWGGGWGRFFELADVSKGVGLPFSREAEDVGCRDTGDGVSVVCEFVRRDELEWYGVESVVTPRHVALGAGSVKRKADFLTCHGGESPAEFGREGGDGWVPVERNLGPYLPRDSRDCSAEGIVER
jgi:hypothetical protein